MSRSITLASVALAALLTISSTAFAMEEADHSAHGEGAAAAHDHGGMVEMPAGAPTPGLSLRVTEDAVGGWNLEVSVENFQFTPTEVNEAHRPGHGHAHLYVNGIKKMRLYGPWLHIGHLPPGANTISVTLNANDHRAYAVSGEAITAYVQVEGVN